MRYFAYGSNMDPRQMADRCPGAIALGAARLDGYRLAFRWDSPGWGGGVADVEAAPNEEVWGVLWELRAAHEEALDRYEGVDAGVYRKRAVLVEQDDNAVRAFLYEMRPDRAPKPPSGRYVRALLRGAGAHGLPERYIRTLRSFLPDHAASRS